MFRTAELGQKIPKSDFKQREPILRQELLELQRDLCQCCGDLKIIRSGNTLGNAGAY